MLPCLSNIFLRYIFFTGLLQTHKELQYGRVSAVELVQAVSELLSTAGIQMDVEKQSLLQNAISMQEQFKESQAALLLEQVCLLHAIWSTIF